MGWLKRLVQQANLNWNLGFTELARLKLGVSTLFYSLLTTFSEKSILKLNSATAEAGTKMSLAIRMKEKSKGSLPLVLSLSHILYY